MREKGRKDRLELTERTMLSCNRKERWKMERRGGEDEIQTLESIQIMVEREIERNK